MINHCDLKVKFIFCSYFFLRCSFLSLFVAYLIFYYRPYRKVVVIGAGYIAVELAGILGVLGSETHLFIRQNRVSF